MQMNIFSWESQQTGIAIQYLMDLRLKKAHEELEPVVSHNPEDPYSSRVMELIEYWQDQMQSCWPLEELSQMDSWYQSIDSFPFREINYEQRLRKKLLLELAQALETSGHFRLNSGVSAAQLYQETGYLQKAEKALRKRLKKSPQNWSLIMHLANLLHLQGQIDDAASLYRKVLLFQPELLHSDLADKKLKQVLNKHGLRYCLPLAGLLRIIPQEEVPVNSIKFLSPEHEHAVHCYQKLCAAERIRRRSSDIQELLPPRKALQEWDPELFQIYMNHIQGSHKISALL